jgi:hypothetical protein
VNARITLMEISRDRTALSVVCSWSAPGVPDPRAVFSKRDQPWWFDEVVRGEVSLASCPDDLPEEAAAEREHFRREGVLSVPSIPLRLGGQVAGAISFATCTAGWPGPGNW